MSKVYFSSARMKALNADSSLPAKFMRMLDKFPLNDMFADKSVAIKMHLGGHLGYTTIPPFFVKKLVDKVKESGGKPFVTDGGSAIATAKDRGYTQEVLGAPVISAQGATNNYYVKVPIGYESLESVELCGEIVNADALIVLSHGKGHGQCGFGGCIKNIAMGNVSYKSRGEIHTLMSSTFEWNEDLCTHCELCVDNCPTNAVRFTDENKMAIFAHHCRYCMHCVTSCPQGAIKIDDTGSTRFQNGMARVTKACLDTFEPGKVLFINHMTSVTPFCDCWGFSSPALVPDIGIVAGTDIVSVETASIDMIKTEDYIKGSLPMPFEVRDVEGHLLQKIHAKDPYTQCHAAAQIGIGEEEYIVEEVD